jgi:hypothetical protein
LHLNIPSTGNTGSRAVLIGDNTRTTMGVFDNGRVGIGTMAPTQLLQLGDEWVFHNGSTKYIGRNVTYVPVAGGSWQNVTMRANQASSLMAFDTDGSIRFENNSSTSMPVGSIANTITRLNISNQGKVSIGNVTTPGDYRLYVEKGILTEKVRVALKTTTNWADYVFAPDYKLKPLAEVEAFVKENKHLPNVPSAEQLVKDGGIDVNEMFAKQMEKIEELTLYIIEQNKKADAQNKQIEQLQTRISQLEKQ